MPSQYWLSVARTADAAGDDVQIEDDFASGVVTLAYDNNGNLTDDGVYKYVYDAWNRLRKATRRVDSETVVGTYVYLADTRRASKVVSNSGVSIDSEYAATYTYDSATGRMTRVTGPGIRPAGSSDSDDGVFYSYLANSDLVEKVVTCPQSMYQWL